MHPLQATGEETARYAARFPEAVANGFYRQAQEWTVSSLGIGTYLGAMDEPTSSGYREAIGEALRGGINFIDTSLNYRHQRSERDIGAAVGALLESGKVRREEFVVATKAGYLVPGAVPPDLVALPEVAGGMHCLAPGFLADQLERSRANLNLETIDLFYLHNPETQLSYVSAEEFYERIRRSFAALEEMAAAGKLRYYGAATWDGFRKQAGGGGGLSLTRLLELAEREGGPRHRFRFIQLPLNLGMAEAFQIQRETIDGERMNVLEVAARFGVTVVASATLMQARLARNLPEEIAARLEGPTSDAQRAIQFTRSTPGVTAALVGMSRAAHVRENLEVSFFPPASREQYLRLFE